ncbi:RNA-directed DNA polymerase from mobile element jockey isoform X1 [Bactrocera dorsalis]|uniref:RNA-directed DNA polymerase from mobile element jockey isoform X1 n=1 Tax=Bactrocera dorsalis TaxID=27457 RepID=A0ABM3JA19_BACDO|nr:RNA-directed DNA polymerase from mobile element jockey isoform X1 [Bactrocera dorsalis]
MRLLFQILPNINQETSNIHKAIRCASNVSFPLSSTKPVKPAPLWWNNEIASLRQAKQQAWHNFKRNRSTTTLIQFKKLNAQFRRKIKDAKLDCFQKFTSSISASSDPKKIWADIKTLTGLPSNSQIYSLNTSHGNLLYPQYIAQEFASHFSNASSDQTFPPEYIASKRFQILQHRITPTTLSPSAKLLEADISLYELQLALSAVKGQTPGIDKISYPIIKHLPRLLLHRLIKHYNNILNTGLYPHAWKTSAIIPLLKPGKSPCEVNSYRPISLLPCLGKLTEKIIATRLTWYAHSNQLIHHNQVAFKKGQATTDALLHVDHFISNALSSKNHVSLLSLDFQKAFDRIETPVVLRQLDKWKIGPKMYNFIKSFLSNRKLSVLISNTRSSIFPLDNGTPQGPPYQSSCSL